MITAYMIIAALSIFAAAAIKMATTEYNFSRRYFAKVKARYLAEAKADEIAYDLAGRIAGDGDEPEYDPAEDEGPARWGVLCGTENNYLSTGYNTGYTCVALDADHQSAAYPMRERHYQISVTATDPQTGAAVTVNDIIIRRKMNVFLHGIFFQDDLEIIADWFMTFTGNIHCNSDIYLSASTNLRLDSDHVEAAGNIYNRRKDSDSTGWGNVEMKVDATPNFERMWKRNIEDVPLDSRRSDWGSASQVRWQGTVKSGAHGITSKIFDSIYSIDPDGHYAGEAGLKILNDDIYKEGAELVEVSYADHNGDGTIDAADFGSNSVPVGTAGTSASFYNFRESRYIKMTDVDLRKLAGWVQGLDGDGNPSVDSDGNPMYVQHYPNHLPSNGLVYATRDDILEGEQPGIRLYNGAEIHNDTGLTLVTNDPAYIQGDFNAVNKKPAAVICDALNVVSNNWDDANSDSWWLFRRGATDTTINASFISGIDDTVGEEYGGGFANYPRLHESWLGKTLAIRGSFVQMWDSRIAVGPWSNSSYFPPFRDWDYDPDLLDTVNFPVFSPRVVSLEKVASWEGASENYPGVFEEEP